MRQSSLLEDVIHLLVMITCFGGLIYLFVCGSKKEAATPPSYGEEYEVTCRLPDNTIKTYTSTWASPSRRGSWYFITTEGVEVRTSFCHVEKHP